MVSSPCGSRRGLPERSRSGVTGRERRPVRPTRRGRAARSAILSTVLAGVLIALPTALPAVGVASPDRGISGSEVVIRPGESLWSVAARHAPDRDPSETVEEIRRLNHLSGYVVYPGQRLRLP